MRDVSIRVGEAEVAFPAGSCDDTLGEGNAVGMAVISAETILCEEDNLQHVIWQLVMATNKVVLLYTIYATCAVSLIESRAYIAKELLLTATQLP